MKDIETQLKLQAFLDGELPEGDRREMANLLARDQQAADLLTELRHTRQALSGYERGLKLPESREFFWSKIQRQIESEQAREAAQRARPQEVSIWVRLRQLLVPATALALVAFAGLIATRGVSQQSIAGETSVADSGALTYRDYSAQATLVWLTYPAENEIAQIDPLDILD
jgi:negative regulator of sigma E activity